VTGDSSSAERATGASSRVKIASIGRATISNDVRFFFNRLVGMNARRSSSDRKPSDGLKRGHRLASTKSIEGGDMTAVRVLVGTRKGAFILTSDGTRKSWDVSGPHFAGWEIYHLKGSPAEPDRIYASQSSGWFGQQIQRSNDGGKTWEPVDNKFAYDGVPGTHQWYDGTPHPWEFKRVWHIEPSLTDPDTVYAGVEDAALFRTTDGGKSWSELSGLRGHGSGPRWQPGAGGMCLHTILLDPTDPKRIFIAISAAGAFRTDDGGETWRPINQGLKSEYIPDPTAEVGHCVHRLAMHGSQPNVLYMQKHWDVMRSNDAGNSWHEVSGNLPTDFGFVIDVHAHEPETIYVVPIKSDSEHFPLEGQLRVWRSRTGGNEWEPLTNGLPQSNCYVNVLRDAMAIDKLDSCGVYFGTTGGQVYASPDAGDSWDAIVRDLPAVLSVEVQTLT
jgi:photosystem II stability/assembly factor-like uncharacterized protein